MRTFSGKGSNSADFLQLRRKDHAVQGSSQELSDPFVEVAENMVYKGVAANAQILKCVLKFCQPDKISLLTCVLAFRIFINWARFQSYETMDYIDFRT